jgi:hypothetical protein
MSKVLDFFNWQKIEEDKEKITNEDLTALLKKAKKQSAQNDFSNFQGNFALSDFKELKKIVQAKIFDGLFREKLVDSDYFHCGEYIASLITRTAKEPPISWYALDYVSQISEENDYVNWQQAADICFLICSVFIERSEHRAMSHKDYTYMGRMFYQMYFDKSKREIGYLMSYNYKYMARITQNCFSF